MKNIWDMLPEPIKGLIILILLLPVYAWLAMQIG